MAIRKFKDWASWLDGLRSKAMEAAGTSIVTLFGTNGVAAMHIPGLNDVGLGWKTAIAQFLIHIVLAAAKYIQEKPDPEVITETVDTTMITKSQTNPP